MATWNSDNIILTKLGEQVLSKVQSGVGKLTVSRIVSGAGHVSPAQLYSQTQITDIKQEMSVVKYTTNEQQSVISANLTNTGLEEAYDLYQIGIYVTHPDFTDEVLYLIAQCDSPDHIPLPGDNPVTLSYDLVMAHFGTKEVTINVSEAGHVDVTTFNEFIEKTNTALNGKANSTDLNEHKSDNTIHVTTEEKESWNRKAELTDIVNYLGEITDVDNILNNPNYSDCPYEGIISSEVATSIGLTSDTGTEWSIKCFRATGGSGFQIAVPIYYDSGKSETPKYRIAVKVYILGSYGINWGKWNNFSDGGNADTVDGKNASDFMQNLGYLNTGSLLDYVLTLTSSGSFFISNSVTDTPVSGLFYGVDVIRHTGGDYVITATRFNGGGVWTNHYNAGAKKWYGWANVADGGNADTVGNKGISQILAVKGWFDGDMDNLKEQGSYIVNGATNMPISGGWGTVLVFAGGTGSVVQIFTAYVTSTSDLCKTYIRHFTGDLWSTWVNIADSGNADTLDGKHASDFSQIISFGDTPTDTKTAIGIQGKTTTYWCSHWTDYPATLQDGQGMIIAVNYKSYGTSVEVDNIWCMQLYICSHDSRIYKRIIIGKAVGSWVSIIDNNIVASSTSSGIVSTGTQQFAGYKIFPTQIAIKTAGTVGTQPTSDINSRMFFTNTDLNAQFGEVRNCIRDSSFTTGEVFTSIHAFSNDHTGSNTIKVVATNNNSGNYVSIGAPTVASSVSCLRNLSSGTASANTTNCPSGAWYGKHS